MRPFSPRALSAGYEGPGSVLVSPVPHQMLPYMNVGTLSRTELQLLNQLHCRRKRRHRTIFTDEQLEALENLFQETKYPDVGTREQLARKVHLREEKVEVGTRGVLSGRVLGFGKTRRVKIGSRRERRLGDPGVSRLLCKHAPGGPEGAWRVWRCWSQALLFARFAGVLRALDSPDSPPDSPLGIGEPGVARARGPRPLQVFLFVCGGTGLV